MKLQYTQDFIINSKLSIVKEVSSSLTTQSFLDPRFKLIESHLCHISRIEKRNKRI